MVCLGAFWWAIPELFFVYFRLFKQTIQFLQENYVKNVHPVYTAGIQTNYLQDMSLLPLPIDQNCILSLNET